MNKDLDHPLRFENLRFFIPTNKGQKYYDEVASSMGASPICYAYPHYVKNYRDVGRGERKAIEIVYIFFNAYNGTVSSSVPGLWTILNKLGVGHHEADFERITVRLNDDESVEGVHYGAHGGNEGIWYFNGTKDLKDKDGYKLDEHGQLIAWSALDTHGNHNRAGNLPRTNATEKAILDKIIGSIGVLTEKTGNGRAIDCQTNLSVIDPADPLKSHPWLGFSGRWGDKMPMGKKNGGSGPPGPVYQNFWRAEVQNPETWLQPDQRKSEPKKTGIWNKLKGRFGY